MDSNCSLLHNITTIQEEEANVSPVWVTAAVLFISCVTVLVNVPAITNLAYTKYKYPNFRVIHLLSLSVTDTLVALSLLPIHWTYLYPEQELVYWKCQGIFIFFAISHCCSKTQVAVICIDRLLLLIMPTWKQKPNYSKKMALINFLMLLSITSTMIIPFILFARPETKIFCKLDNLFCENIVLFALYTGIVALIFHVFIIGCCVVMITILQKRRRYLTKIRPISEPGSISSAGQDTNTQINQRRERVILETKAILTILLIAMLYTICVTPLNLGFFLQGVGLFSNASRVMRNIITAVGCLNSAINPLIYCFMVPEVKAARKIFLLQITSLMYQ